jgi:hypothetical protein
MVPLPGKRRAESIVRGSFANVGWEDNVNRE